MALGGFHQLCGDAVCHILPDDLPDGLHHGPAILPLGKCRHGKTVSHLGQCITVKARRERLAFRDKGIEAGALAGQDIRQYHPGGKIGALKPWEPVCDYRQPIGQIRVKLHPGRLEGGQVNRGAARQLFPGDRSEQALDHRQGSLRFDIAHYDQDRVVRRVPVVIKPLEHGAGRFVEGSHRAKGVMLVRGPLEQLAQQAGAQDILGIGQVLNHLLLDGTALLSPRLAGIEDSAHSHRLHMKSGFHVFNRNGKEVLCQGLFGLGVEIPAHGGDDG